MQEEKTKSPRAKSKISATKKTEATPEVINEVKPVFDLLQFLADCIVEQIMKDEPLPYNCSSLDVENTADSKQSQTILNNATRKKTKPQRKKENTRNDSR